MTDPTPASAPWWSLPIAILGVALAAISFAVRPNDNSAELAEVRAELDSLTQLEDQIQLIAAGNNTLEANDATLAEWAAQVSADIVQLQIAVVEQPERVSELIAGLNDRLDDLARLLTTPEALNLLDGVDLSQYEAFLAEQQAPIGGPDLDPVPSPAAVTTTTQAPSPTISSEAAAATVDTGASGRTFSAAVEQWRPIVSQYWPEWAVDEALHTIRNESNGCRTAVAYRASECPDEFVPAQNSTGCQARGPLQGCLLFWSDRAVAAGYPECAPDFRIVDPECHFPVHFWLWETNGCDWRDWSSTRPSWRRGFC